MGLRRKLFYWRNHRIVTPYLKHIAAMNASHDAHAPQPEQEDAA
jgi:hypothetical protein